MIKGRIEKVVGEGIEHSYNQNCSFSSAADFAISSDKSNNREYYHVKEMPNYVENETKTFVHIFRVRSLQKPNQVYKWKKNAPERYFSKDINAYKP